MPSFSTDVDFTNQFAGIAAGRVRVADPTQAAIRLAIFGNSIGYFGSSDYYCAAEPVSSNYGTLTSIVTRGTGPGITAAGSGTLEYRAADSAFRWTAPGDTAGPYTSFTSTFMRLQSGSPDRWLLMYWNGNAALPGADTSLTIAVATGTDGNITGVVETGPESRGMLTWLRAILYQPWDDPDVINLAVGGMTSAGLVASIPRFEAGLGATSGNAVFILDDILFNDQTPVSSAGTMPAALAALQANVTTWLNWALRFGARVILVGARPRYKTGTTVPDAWQVDMAMQYDAWLKRVATALPDRVWYVPVYHALADTTVETGIPAANVLVDNAHDNVLGAYRQATEIAKAPFLPNGSAGRIGNPKSLLAGINGSLQTAGTPTGTGFSGVGPSAAIVGVIGRASGTDIAAVGSYAPRTGKGSGNWFKQAITWVSATAGQIWEFRIVPRTLAQLGKAVGDTIQAEVDIRIDNCVNVESVQCFQQFIGAAGTQRTNLLRHTTIFIAKTFPITGFEGRLRAYPTKIPAGTTQVNTYFWVRTNGGPGSCDLFLANVDIF